MTNRRLTDEELTRLPPYIDPSVLVELLDALPESAHRTIIDLLIDPQQFLGVTAELFASRLGSDDQRLSAILSRLYRDTH
jgi:hypothetical protein